LTENESIFPNSVEIVPNSCPSCGHAFIFAAESSFKEQCRPRPGDLSVCIRCAAVLSFINSAGDLRLATQQEIDELKPDTLYQLRKVQEGVRRANENLTSDQHLNCEGTQREMF
jgi:hypothetical protein